ncbi:MAG: metallophosphoesterase [Planctomycetaceae bacterium]|nr:metallophosphoesterase [Planctomycetaceae bacterium]
MPRVCFASDFHLFSRRSTGDSHFEALVRIAKDCDYCVLGGDMFDFRWSVLTSDEATAQAALEWLARITDATDNTVVHFLFGNHDDHPLMHQLLPSLSTKRKDFEFSRFYYRLGNTIFLHGDVADRTMTAACLEQQRDSFHHGSRTPMQHRLYDLAVKAQLHRITPHAVYPKKRVAQRILSYLESIGHGINTGIEHVCFGHTHRPVDHYVLEGVTFHNCGAPIGTSNFRIVTRDVTISSAMPSSEPSIEIPTP